jgi:hypothetical protein
MPQRRAARADVDPAVAIGRDLVGPALCQHVHRSIAAIDDEAIDRVYFLARDGHLLLRLYQRLASLHRRPAPPARYLHVSRRATLLPSMTALTRRELSFALAQPRARGLHGVLRSCNLDDEEVQAAARRAGVDELLAPVRDLERDARVARLLGDAPFQALVAARAAAARTRLLAYLAQEGLSGGGRAALIDVGWRGTIQDNLVRVLAHAPAAPELRGLYLGLFIDDPGPLDRAPYKRGTVYDGARARGLGGRAPLHFVHLFEQIGRPDEGMTVGYRERDGRVVPELKEEGADHAVERGAHPLIARLQEGVLAAADAYVARPAEDADTQTPLSRLIFAPSAAERATLHALSCGDDLTVSHAGAAYETAPPRSVRGFLDGFYGSAWKPAYLAHHGGLPLATLFRWWEALKLRLR